MAEEKLQHAPSLTDFVKNLYGSPSDKTEHLILNYEKIYNLPKIQGEWDVNNYLFNHSRGIRNFVLVAVYNHKRELLIVDSHSSKFGESSDSIGPRLVGGAIRDEHAESIEEAIARIVKRNTGLGLYEVEPVACLRNTFRNSSESVTHVGIAFIARAEHELVKPVYDYHKFATKKPSNMAFSNGEVFNLAMDRIRAKHLSPPMDEIRAGERNHVVSMVHQYLFKPFVSQPSSKKLKSKLRKLIGEPKSYLDASAGDDEFVIEIAKDVDPTLIVANDVSWQQMARLRRIKDRMKLNVIFTNHNAAELPFEVKFDVTLHKNTLHHVSSGEELLLLLSRLRTISNRLILVDVEEPRRVRTHRAINWYYEEFYGDGSENHRFLSRGEFRTLVSTAYSDEKFSFKIVKTLKANYLVAIVDFAQNEAKTGVA